MRGDRNRAAKDEFLQAQGRKQFLAQVASGQTGAYDKERTRLETGQLVIWNPPPDILYWLIKDVGPALDLPHPALRVTLTITVPIILPPGQRMGNILVVGKQEDQDPKALARDTIAGDHQDDQKPEGPGEPPAGESPPRAPERPADGRDATHDPGDITD